MTTKPKSAKALRLASCGWEAKAGLVRTISVTDTQAIEASIENEITQELEANGVMYALLYPCTSCGRWHVSKHHWDVIRRNLEQGSARAPLKVRKMNCPCGKVEQRLNSARGTHVVACVNANRPSEVRNLRVIAEGMNMYVNARLAATGTIQLMQESGNPRFIPEIEVIEDNIEDMPTFDEYYINDRWFEIVRGVTQGRGRRFWCMPIRRWRNFLRGDY